MGFASSFGYRIRPGARRGWQNFTALDTKRTATCGQGVRKRGLPNTAPSFPPGRPGPLRWVLLAALTTLTLSVGRPTSQPARFRFLLESNRFALCATPLAC